MIVGVTTWRGSGSTTLATLLTATWSARGSRPWLIEADPAGGILAARLDLIGGGGGGGGGGGDGGGDGGGGGLEHVAFPEARASGGHEQRFGDAAVEWGSARVISAPGDPFRAWASHLPRLPWAPLLRELDEPVVVDLGRARGGAPIAPLLAQLDLLLVTTSTDLASVVSTTEWAESRGRVSPGDAGLALDLTRIVIVDTPDGRVKVARTDAAAELGDRCAGWLPWSPGVVDLVERGAPVTDRRIRRQPLVRAVDELVTRIEAWTNSEVAA